MTDGSCLDDPAGLRPYLIAMRGGLVNWLVRDGIEDSTLSLLANVGTAIEVCLAAEPPADMVATGRAVLSDDGAAITLTRNSAARIALSSSSRSAVIAGL
jgi:hypothetical protein